LDLAPTRVEWGKEIEDKRLGQLRKLRRLYVPAYNTTTQMVVGPWLGVAPADDASMELGGSDDEELDFLVLLLLFLSSA